MNKKLVIILGIIGILATLGLSRLLLSMREAGGNALAGTRPGSLTYRLERLDEEIAGLDAVEPALPTVAGDFAALEGENALAAALAPDAVDFAATEKYLIGISRKAEVDLASITPEDEPARIAGNIEMWRVRVVIAGSFDQVAAFVDAVENPDDVSANAPRLIDVADLEVSGDTADGYHECRLTLQLYRYEDDGVVSDSPPASKLAEMLAAKRSRYAPGGRDPMRMRQGEAAAPSEEPAPAPPPLPESPEPEAPAPEAPDIPENPAPETPIPESPALPLPDDSPEETSLPGLRVDGISWSPDNPRAVVNGAIYRVGDSVAGMDGLRIESIQPSAVVFDHNGEPVRVPVRMFGSEEIR